MTSVPLLTPVRGSRVLAFLRHRFASSQTRALVPVNTAPGPATFAEILAAPDAYWVDLGERNDSFTSSLPPDPATGLGRNADVTLVWWVHDPWAAVRRRVFEGLAHIRRDVAQRLDKVSASRVQLSPEDFEDALYTSLDKVATLDEFGLRYGHVRLDVVQQSVSEVRRRELDDLRWDIAVEEERQRLARTRLAYCRTLIQEGPDTLLAYWLLQRPDDIGRIVEEVRQHRPAPEPNEQEHLDRELLGLLTRTTDYERNRVRQLVAFAVSGRSGPGTRQVLGEMGLLDADALAALDHMREEPSWP